MELRGAKARFCLREKFYKRVHEICFELTKQISVILRENPAVFVVARRYLRAAR